MGYKMAFPCSFGMLPRMMWPLEHSDIYETKSYMQVLFKRLRAFGWKQ